MPDGWPISRDPRRITEAELRALVHEPMSPLAALRARCLDYCGGSADEVRKCVAVECPSWPFRMGVNSWRTVSEAKREAGRALAARRLEKAFAARSEPQDSEEIASEVVEHRKASTSDGIEAPP
jgi:hypothetical protein